MSLFEKKTVKSTLINQELSNIYYFTIVFQGIPSGLEQLVVLFIKTGLTNTIRHEDGLAAVY